MVLPDPALLGSLLELVREARQTVAHSPLVIGICASVITWLVFERLFLVRMP